MGANTAIVNAAEPEVTPDQRATSARSVTPKDWMYIGRKGKPSPKPTRVKNCVAAAIQAVLSQTGRTGIAGIQVRRLPTRAPRVGAAGRTGTDITRGSLAKEGVFPCSRKPAGLRHLKTLANEVLPNELLACDCVT